MARWTHSTWHRARNRREYEQTNDGEVSPYEDEAVIHVFQHGFVDPLVGQIKVSSSVSDLCNPGVANLIQRFDGQLNAFFNGKISLRGLSLGYVIG